MFGMYAFHGSHGHSHGGDARDSTACNDEVSEAKHSHSHSHSHSHGHSHGGNANMQGIFLNIFNLI